MVDGVCLSLEGRWMTCIAVCLRVYPYGCVHVPVNCVFCIAVSFCNSFHTRVHVSVREAFCAAHPNTSSLTQLPQWCHHKMPLYWVTWFWVSWQQLFWVCRHWSSKWASEWGHSRPSFHDHSVAYHPTKLKPSQTGSWNMTVTVLTWPPHSPDPRPQSLAQLTHITDVSLGHYACIQLFATKRGSWSRK